eukprot:28658-Pelagococcus_subviridis.AAC.1
MWAFASAWLWNGRRATAATPPRRQRWKVERSRHRPFKSSARVVIQIVHIVRHSPRRYSLTSRRHLRRARPLFSPKPSTLPPRGN